MKNTHSEQIMCPLMFGCPGIQATCIVRLHILQNIQCVGRCCR